MEPILSPKQLIQESIRKSQQMIETIFSFNKRFSEGNELSVLRLETIVFQNCPDLGN